MALISFKAKPETIYTPEDEIAFTRIKVPVLTRSHCDMAAMRSHPKFSGIANSDLLPAALARLRKDRLGDYVRLDRIPNGVTVRAHEKGFLWVVELEA